MILRRLTCFALTPNDAGRTFTVGLGEVAQKTRAAVVADELDVTVTVDCLQVPFYVHKTHDKLTTHVCFKKNSK